MSTSRPTLLAAIGLSLVLAGCAGESEEWTAPPASAAASGSSGASGSPGTSGSPAASDGGASPGASGSAEPSASAPASPAASGSPSPSASGSPAASASPTAPASPSGSPAASPSGSPAASQSPGAGSAEVTIGTDEGLELLFVPETAEAPAGAQVTLTFQNVSQAPHNLTFSDPIDAATETIVAPGASETLEFTAPEPGDYPFVCTLHPGMDGVLTVTE